MEPGTSSERDEVLLAGEPQEMVVTSQADYVIARKPVALGAVLSELDSGGKPRQQLQVTMTQASDKSALKDRVGSFRARSFAERTHLGGWFPSILDDENSNLRIWLSRRSRALMIQIVLIGLILFTNLSLTIFAVSSYGSNEGVSIIYQGDCSTVRSLDQWLHLLINLLATGMLSASNYCMQLQAAPTRGDVDRAHGNGTWLAIGIPSLRNLRYIGGWRRFSWVLLAFSSVPIHLIYNSAVFQSLSSHNYTVAVVKDSFITGSSWSLATAEANRAGDNGWDEARVNPPEWNHTQIIQGMQDNAARYQRLNVSACFDLYDDYWIPQGNALVLVRNESLQTDPNDSLLMYVSIIPRSDDWGKNMWALGNGTGEFKAQSPQSPITTWYLGPKRYEVSSCLVQPPEQLETQCRFEYSPPIMFTICMMNFVKAAIMLFIWTRRRREDRQSDPKKQTLYTLGDAIGSFMRAPDDKTIGMCLATKADFRTKRTWYGRRIEESTVQESTEQESTEQLPPARVFKEEVKTWKSAASVRQWVIFLSTCLVVIMIAAILLGLAIISLRHRDFHVGVVDLWHLGFGSLTPYTFLVLGLPRDDPAGLISNVLLANLPQLVLSILYILYNTMLSTFLVQREFSRMHLPKYRKPLRVSEPIGIQRSSYFISLPLRYGIPLYASSGFMHWLISQSLFLARITAIMADGTDDAENSFSTCGYSPIALFITIFAGLLLIVIIVVVGFRKYGGTMRLVATNSKAIAAACHVLEEDKSDGHMFPVQWGVVSMHRGEGHCAFTTARTGTVGMPQEGVSYR
ncbi:hypothetical protein S7711_02589 [Stachybotrys chartarum IBT 7711]|uniref:DUF6536 domain-containing protein n=1 Tax=Stachybotrys chartarum (strain CBS 109288 / IBT 7711) TaxID=1280523 RepID=A0A084B8W6_STACB|nr:hypothetical protein S7711_02589 [Stachybotrys chartarum IBT 7711]